MMSPLPNGYFSNKASRLPTPTTNEQSPVPIGYFSYVSCDYDAGIPEGVANSHWVFRPRTMKLVYFRIHMWVTSSHWVSFRPVAAQVVSTFWAESPLPIGYLSNSALAHLYYPTAWGQHFPLGILSTMEGRPRLFSTPSVATPQWVFRPLSLRCRNM